MKKAGEQMVHLCYNSGGKIENTVFLKINSGYNIIIDF